MEEELEMVPLFLSTDNSQRSTVGACKSLMTEVFKFLVKWLIFNFQFSIFNSKKICCLLSVVRCLFLTLQHEIFNRLSRKYRCRI